LIVVFFFFKKKKGENRRVKGEVMMMMGLSCKFGSHIDHEKERKKVAKIKNGKKGLGK